MQPDVQFARCPNDLVVNYDADGRITPELGIPIDVQLCNHSEPTAIVSLLLHWCEPNIGAPPAFRRNIANELAIPATGFSVPPTTDETPPAVISLMWTPTKTTLATVPPTHGCLFVQTIVEPIFPDFAGAGDSNDWEPTSALNSQQNLYVVSAPEGTPAINFALGAGHAKSTERHTRIRTDAAPDLAQLTALLLAQKFDNTAPIVEQAIHATDATLIEGVECVVAPEHVPSCATPIRLGNVGVLSDSMADALATNSGSTVHRLTLQPGMLRQVIVNIPIPSLAKRNSVVFTTIIHEPIRTFLRTPPAPIGTATVAVRIV